MHYAQRLCAHIHTLCCVPAAAPPRLVSQNTIEENILRKSDQKRQLDWLAIQSGGSKH